MGFKIGTRVRVINEDEKGVIVKQLPKLYYLIESADGFERPFHESNLIEDEDFLSLQYQKVEKKIPSARDIRREERKKLKDAIKENKVHVPWKEFTEKKINVIEVDLHIEELVPMHKHMNNREIIEVQMRTFRRCVNHAINQRFTKIVAIHGVGAGTLKTTLRTYIKEKFHYMEVMDANYKKYGQGATEILIHHSSRR